MLLAEVVFDEGAVVVTGIVVVTGPVVTIVVVEVVVFIVEYEVVLT